MSRRVARSLLSAATVGAVLAALAGCSPDDEGTTGSAAADEPGAHGSEADGHRTGAPTAEPRPLRPGERRVRLAMPEAYTPSAPNGAGTDDYRCFLLDPELDRHAWITGTHVQPGNADVVHHVILFRVPAQQAGWAEAVDAGDPGPGWTCFGGTGIDPVQQLDDAPWLGAWAPGGEESVHKPGYGVRLAKGSQIVMQVHYNLLAGDAPDVSATQLRLAPGDRDLQSIETMLMPGPVELPCRADHDDSPLCERDAAVADVKERFGERAGSTADFLHFLCGDPEPGETQSCTRRVNEPMTVHGVAGHMHLLGRSLRVEVNPGTPRARTLLDIPVWDFDDQGARPIRPVRVNRSDTLRVTCRHVQWLRDELPAFEGQPDRYVLWGEGTTDEMCLGILQVTRR